MWMSFFEIFGNKKCIFWAKTLTERWYLLITEKFLFWTFRWWKIRSFFESKSWWKDDIYWLLTSFCFELFGDGKYGLFSPKKLMERWYLLGIFQLSMIFQHLGNMVFCAVPEEIINQELRVKRTDEIRNYLIEEINRNELMSKTH